MIYFQENNKHPRSEIVADLAKRLRQGQVLVLPTDTIYGLSCLATKIAAVKKIKRLKKRPVDKPFILLFSGLAMLKKYAFVSRSQSDFFKEKVAKRRRPTTLILRGRGLLPPIVEKPGAGLACRLPKNEFLIKILKTVNQPLVSTSVNLSGQPPLLEAKEIIRRFRGRVCQPEAILDTGLSAYTKPSRVLDIRRPNKIIVLRP